MQDVKAQMITMPRSGSRTVMWLAGVVFAISSLGVAQNIWRELTTFVGDYTHVDEIFFAVCATRGLSVGDIPISGCHDNKAPLIYLLYQLVEVLSGRYSLIGIKVAGAFCTVAAIASVAFLGYRIAGVLAAVLGAMLAAQVLAINSELLAFKTELVGTIFMLIGAMCLLSWRLSRSALTLCWSGLYFGLAIMTKQTFAFGVFGAGIWLLFCPVADKPGELSVRAIRWLLFNFAVMLPAILFFAIFAFRGQSLDFLASVFLHAMAYGTGGAPLSWSEHAWKAGWILHQFGLVYPLTLAFSAALAVWIYMQGTRPAVSFENSSSLGLLFSLSLCMAVVPVISRQYFLPHLLPAWLLMAVAAGVSIAGWQKWGVARYGGRGDWQVAVGTVSLIAALLMFVNSWYMNGDVKKREAAKQHVLDEGSRIPNVQGSYGYVLGVRPEFYFFNGIIPASDVLYPAALIRDGQASPNTETGKQENLLSRLSVAMQTHATRRLMEDFAITPPDHIFLVDRWARSTGTQGVTDVKLLGDYIRTHCVHSRTVVGKPYQTGNLYVCGRG